MILPCRSCGSLTKALLSTLSKLVVSNGGEISGPENAAITVVGKCALNKEPEKLFCLPKVMRPEQDKLQANDNIVYHAWISKCVTEGKIVDCEEYKALLVSHTTKELPQLNFDTSALFHDLAN